MKRTTPLALLILTALPITAAHAQLMPFDHGKRLYDAPEILEQQRETDPDGPYESYLKIQYPPEAYRITRPSRCPIVVSTHTPPDEKRLECRKYYTLSTQGRGSLLFLVHNTAIAIGLQSSEPFDPALNRPITFRITSINIQPIQAYNTNRVAVPQAAEGRCNVTRQHTLLCAGTTGIISLTVATQGP